MIEDIIKQANSQGYSLVYDRYNKSIKTKKGYVKINLNRGKGVAHCYPFGNDKRIELYSKNIDIVKDLIHERNHFQILPYDFITYSIISLGVLVYSGLSLYQNNDKNLLMHLSLETITFATMGIFGGVNLIGDGIIKVIEKLKLNRSKNK